MAFYSVQNLDEDLIQGSFGIYEPRPSLPPLKFTQDVVALVPGLAYTAAGTRLGRGGGYYDTFLSKTPCIKLAPAYEEQIEPWLPCEDHDIAVDIIVTPERIIRTGVEDRKHKRKDIR